MNILSELKFGSSSASALASLAAGPAWAVTESRGGKKTRASGGASTHANYEIPFALSVLTLFLCISGGRPYVCTARGTTERQTAALGITRSAYNPWHTVATRKEPIPVTDVRPFDAKLPGHILADNLFRKFDDSRSHLQSKRFLTLSCYIG